MKLFFFECYVYDMYKILLKVFLICSWDLLVVM